MESINNEDNKVLRLVHPLSHKLTQGNIFQTIDVEYTDKNGVSYCDRFEDSTTPDYLQAITAKIAFIAECHLFMDNEVDFSSPVTIKYFPPKQTT